MAELQHWTRFWHSTEGMRHRTKFPGLVNSSALSPFDTGKGQYSEWELSLFSVRFQYCFQGPVVRWIGWMPCVMFAVSSFAIASWAGNSGSHCPNPTSPALSKQNAKYFLLTNILQAFDFLIPLNGRGCWGEARMKPPFALGTACAAETNAHVGMGSAGFSCCASNVL